MIPCNILHEHAGIDWDDPDPEHDFTVVQRECGKPARYANRHSAGEPESFACDGCFTALGPEGQVDWWPLKAEHQPGGDRSPQDLPKER